MQSPGRLVGVLMRYGDVGQGGRETFSPGALSWPANGIRIDEQHASSPARGSVQPPIMRTIPVVAGDEVRLDCLLPDTQRGRDLAPLMQMDPPVYTGLSVEFRAVREHRASDRRRAAGWRGVDGQPVVQGHARRGARRSAPEATPVAVTADQVQGEVPGISTDDATALIAVAEAEVDVYLNGGATVDAVRDHAVLRLVRFLHAVPGEAGGRVEVDGIDYRGPGVGDPMQRSGAQQLLARFRRRTVPVAHGNEVTT